MPWSPRSTPRGPGRPRCCTSCPVRCCKGPGGAGSAGPAPLLLGSAVTHPPGRPRPPRGQPITARWFASAPMGRWDDGARRLCRPSRPRRALCSLRAALAWGKCWGTTSVGKHRSPLPWGERNKGIHILSDMDVRNCPDDPQWSGVQASNL